MQCQTFILRLGEEKDLDQLNTFLSRVAPLQVSSSLVQGNPPFWSVLVFFEGDAPSSTIVPQKTKTAQAAKPEKVFESSNTVAFEALRQWRSAKAREENVPPYVVANNSELEEIIKANPKTPEQLEAIKGFGKIKREKYGLEILEILRRS